MLGIRVVLMCTMYIRGLYVDQVLARGGHFNVCGVSIHIYGTCMRLRS